MLDGQLFRDLFWSSVAATEGFNFWKQIRLDALGSRRQACRRCSACLVRSNQKLKPRMVRPGLTIHCIAVQPGFFSGP